MWDQARMDIPRERGYYPAISDAVRASSPFVPATGNDVGGPRIPLIGLLVVAGVILALEHFRRGR